MGYEGMGKVLGAAQPHWRSVKEYRVGVRRDVPQALPSHREAAIIAPEGASQRAPTHPEGSTGF